MIEDVFYQYLEERWAKEIQKAQEKEAQRQQKENVLETVYRISHGVNDNVFQ